MLLSKRTLHHRSDIYKDFWIEHEYVSAKMNFLPSRDEEIYNDDTQIMFGLNPQQMDIALNTKDIRND